MLKDGIRDNLIEELSKIDKELKAIFKGVGIVKDVEINYTRNATKECIIFTLEIGIKDTSNSKDIKDILSILGLRVFNDDRDENNYLKKESKVFEGTNKLEFCYKINENKIHDIYKLNQVIKVIREDVVDLMIKVYTV